MRVSGEVMPPGGERVEEVFVVEGADFAQLAVEMVHACASCALVEVVDVLCDDVDVEIAFEPRDGAVAFAWLHFVEL